MVGYKAAAKGPELVFLMADRGAAATGGRCGWASRFDQLANKRHQVHRLNVVRSPWRAQAQEAAGHRATALRGARYRYRHYAPKMPAPVPRSSRPSSTTRRYGGTGLALGYLKKLAQPADGEGGGSQPIQALCFWATVPLD